ncbi:hypothetical protein [Streptomyces aurantiogriseus]|uniref:hypothetical protein n=1 Tax=Streptomyces aurantiogriseus TaxID=66870 RepID=UPI0016770E52|nr:hypothetical protein [Streptomyces aurantiogriseus]
MAAVIASVAGALILAGIVHDTARLITTTEPRRPPLARLRGRRAPRRLPPHPPQQPRPLRRPPQA